MGRDENGGSAQVDRLEDLHDFNGHGSVEVSGRFVGEEERAPTNKSRTWRQQVAGSEEGEVRSGTARVASQEPP